MFFLLLTEYEPSSEPVEPRALSFIGGPAREPGLCLIGEENQRRFGSPTK